MLISNKHKFIFIHIAKVAGQSISNALMPYCAEPYQKLLSPAISYRLQLKINTQLKRHFGIMLNPQPYPDHIRAEGLRDILGAEEFNTYYSFAFVRNPWDWLLSNYTYALTNRRHYRHRLVTKFSSFDDYVEWHCTEENQYPTQGQYIFDQDGRQIVSFVGRYESLESDYQRLCSDIGIVSSLPKLNVSKNRGYRTRYSKAAKELVGCKYASDIQLLCYDF